MQNDFASRIRWTLGDAIEKPPVIVVNGVQGIQPITIPAKVSETIEIDASESFSSHGAKLSYKWMQYNEPNAYTPGVSLSMTRP